MWRNKDNMTEKEEWRRIKDLEAFPVPRELCLFHGTDGHLRAMPLMPQGKHGDLRSLASLQEADKVCTKNWVNQLAGSPTLPDRHTLMSKDGWPFFLPSRVSVLLF